MATELENGVNEKDLQITELKPDQSKSKRPEINENLRDLFVLENAVAESECGPTEFSNVQNKYVNQLVTDPYWNSSNYALYTDLQFYYSYFNTEDQYFGENGKATRKVEKRIKDLERFFDMHN